MSVRRKCTSVSVYEVIPARDEEAVLRKVSVEWVRPRPRGNMLIAVRDLPTVKKGDARAQ